MLKINTKDEFISPEVEVHALSHDGRGIATVASKTTFLAGALPTETVTYSIHQKRSTFNEGRAMQIIKPSAERQTPPCEHFGICGGCALQHMSMSLQMSLKQQTLLDQLKHFGQVVPESLIPPLMADTLGYRRKARLGVKFVIKKDKMLVGFREKSSRYLADLQKCEVLHPQIGLRLEELGALVRSLTIYQQIPQIEVAIGDSDVALVFRHMRTLDEQDEEKLIAYGRETGFQIYLQPNSPDKIRKLFPNDGFERLTYTLPDQALEFLFYPLDFTQINLAMNRMMVNQAISLLNVNKEEKVLDLFCGIGNFSLAIARSAKHVIGIEGDAEMVFRARENAAHNNIENVTFAAANLMDPGLSASWMKDTYDKILLDPPRAGAKEILPAIAMLGAKKIVYVSCNPATLARDAFELVHKYGYQLKQAGVMNMFPHTAHIEAMAVFDKL